MRYETYETRAPFSYRAVLITLTSHVVVIDFRQGRISTAEPAGARFGIPKQHAKFGLTSRHNQNFCDGDAVPMLDAA